MLCPFPCNSVVEVCVALLLTLSIHPWGNFKEIVSPTVYLKVFYVPFLAFSVDEVCLAGLTLFIYLLFNCSNQKIKLSISFLLSTNHMTIPKPTVC